MDNNNKQLADALVEFMNGLNLKSEESNKEAIDEAFMAGFHQALDYVSVEIENVDDIEHEVDECAGELSLCGSITIQLDQYLDADDLVQRVIQKHERNITKDGSDEA
ncbi:hypothetical protein OAA64_02170 [bacterium]|nr:hypothetical protein [bacterium]